MKSLSKKSDEHVKEALEMLKIRTTNAMDRSFKEVRGRVRGKESKVNP